MTHSDLVHQVSAILQHSGLSENELKASLSEIVQGNWPSLPVWSTLKSPVIEEVQKSTVGVGVVLTFKEHGIQKVVVAEAGDHYRKPQGNEFYMIPGGFINLSATTGSTLVAESSNPEDPRVGAAREVEEEFKNADGSPLLVVEPSRLKPMDTKTLLLPSGEVRIVIGMMLELTPEEVRIVKEHTAKIAAEPAYKEAAANQSINSSSGKPEVSSVAIFPIKYITEEKQALLHKDQLSLFKIVSEHFQSASVAR